MDFNLVGGAGSAGAIDGIKAAVDKARGAFRVSTSPLDYIDLAGNFLGHYRTVCISGSTASIGAGGILFSCRWGLSTPIAVITRIQAAFEVLTAVTAATPMDLEAIGYKGYTVADTSGGVITPSRMRSAMASSAFDDFRMATGAAALAAGTRTLDATGFGYASFPPKVSPDIGATAATALAAGVGSNMQDLYKWEGNGGHPFILSKNEGFAIRQSVAGPTTGTVRWTFVIEHCELAGF